MNNKRKQYNPQFKAKVALDAVRGEKTVPELSGAENLEEAARDREQSPWQIQYG